MEFRPNDTYTTSESAPLIEPVDCESDRDLFMVPLKRPSPRLPPARYRNVKPRSPPRSPTAASKHEPNHESSPEPASASEQASPYQSRPMSGRVMKPETPPMYTSPLMSPESGSGRHRSGTHGSPNPQSSAGNRTNMATPGSLAYHSPPMSGRGTRAASSAIMSLQTGSSRQSPQPDSSARETATCANSSADKGSPSTKASSVYDDPPITTHDKPSDGPNEQQQAPEIPRVSSARALRQKPTQNQVENLGLALQLQTIDPSLLTVPQPDPEAKWTVPDSPMERLSQLRATPDSAYDRARQMEIRRSEWKHVVYRFPIKGKSHWVLDVDLTESSHARLADVARRSSEGFEWNGDYELANIYRVLAVAHGKVVEEMRGERRLGRVEVKV
ncbi:hypothetical protein MMYC01_209841 [Madurella mycetomatis]|uniref:Uncharacterized protein n=1 Tax=Madurella mycetomatis TaxID=100816 RepID=A0A175VR92_9PEZI|nr:hypothetical protein MMYC01_209838 [Madurella mycetomatis]KXX73278.1 hypothetical protein MMYC01_209841 [Madurella mycetomatis]